MHMTTLPSAARTHGETAGAEPMKFVRRVGSTRYGVTIRFSETATETLENKVFRLIEREVQNA
jgi:hypothetical protein